MNEIENVYEMAHCAPENTCNTCHRTSFEFVREATQDDHDGSDYDEWKKRQKKAISES